VSAAHVLVLGDPTGALAHLVDDDEEVEAVADVDRCLERLEDGAVSLVVVDAAWERPLAAARQIRRGHQGVGLAVAVESAQIPAMRSRLAFVPDVEHVHVVPADAEVPRLRHELLATVGEVGRHRRVRGALDAINRDLAGGWRRSEPEDRAGRPSVSAQYLAALVRHAADTIVSVDPEGCVVTINEAGSRTLGATTARIEGRPLRELFADDDEGGLSRLVTQAGSGEPQADDEVPVRLRSGHELLLSATAAPIDDDTGRLAGIVVIARDVTSERRAAQRLQSLQKAESLATLASGVAHDFNNLLVQAQGWADLARDDLEDPELVATALERIGHATRRASELARTMLAYGGRGRFEPQTIDLAELVRDLEPLLSASVPAKVRLELDLDVRPRVRADATQLRQIVLNLVTNAVEAIGDVPGSIHVRVLRQPAVERPELHAPGGVAVIEVSDSGPGIAADVRERLFDPFFTTKFTGRGLGLAASQGIAAAHGGTLAVTSEPGSGAVFQLRLPEVGERS
jgi:PAS domain S-box-containing protein